VTGFVGREREAAEVDHLLAEARLLTLTGAPGVGKTRLALEVAASRLGRLPGMTDQPGGSVDTVGPMRDGVWLVELAPLTSPEQVPQAIAAVLGVRERPGTLLTDTLVEALRPCRLLLLLDNCEHLVEACASLADTLLRTCRRLQLLATSREALGITGETVFPVPVLSPPEAGRLFAARARAALPSFRVAEENAAALTQVCRRLDGIPLALELAAARVTALTPAQLAQRLDDCFRVLTVGRRTALPRQQTLRATLDWSHDLLSAPERVLLRRLAVFAGTWTLEAAEGVCADDGLAITGSRTATRARDEILALLVQLVEKSLVAAEEQAGSAVYRVLETIRQYGVEKMRAVGEEQTIRDRHLAWFAAVAEQAEEPLWSADQAAWLARLTADEENLRAALAWSTRTGDSVAGSSLPDPGAVEAGLRLGGALWHFWNLHGRMSEGRARLARLLQTGLGTPATRAKALHAAAYLAFVEGDAAESTRRAGEMLLLDRRVLHPFYFASAMVGQATGALLAGDAARATALCEEALAQCRQAGERRGMYYALYGLMEVSRAQGNTARAVALMEEAHGLTLEQGDSWSIAFALSIIGNLVLLQGDVARAETLQRESLALRQAIDDTVGLGRCLDSLGWVASARGQPVRAARLFGAAEALRERTGAAPHLPWRREHERWVTAAWAALDETAFSAAWAEGRALTLDGVLADLESDAGQATDEPSTVETPGASVRRRSPPAPRPGGLSPREMEVTRLIAQGHTNRAIAEALVIAEWTVDTHVRHILGKLGYRSRAQVAAWASEHGLV
jgi:non-specific serine/threonine protein kinase